MKQSSYTGQNWGRSQSTPTIIRVGHPAYVGINGARVCFSKAQAVRVLQARGVAREEARDAVNKAIKNHGHTAHTRDRELIELRPLTNEVDPLYYKKFREYWSQHPEA